ncbi:hypothetical protein J5N97_007447 [Dioscorea zingiberensis]|uniref:Uncharacterized protein n=1 Tax=Dioscorea zingiberensis TaxID=325984 RepID=A0A9D5DBT3_9LILI|nr:hypothetical protein J5N97_007447 [Dioscorea zingiberensis]
MGAYDSMPGDGFPYGQDRRTPWTTAVHGGSPAIGNLSDQFLGLDVGGSSKDHLVQVMNAVEDAENIISIQMEENRRLKDELERKKLELQQYKLGSTSPSPTANLPTDEHDVGHYKNGAQESEATSVQPSSGNNLYSESNKMDVTFNGLSGVQAGAENSGRSQLSTPSSSSFSPTRYRREGEYDSRITLPVRGLLPVSDANSNLLLKQDLAIKVREREEEIFQLRKHLAAYSVKEEQIRNEKFVLEKRIAYMRMAFDRQQQDLVDAASKSLSYRQDIMEENVRLTYALQAAQDERKTFVSSLLPLLAEYSLQPSVLDAQSIVSNLKILFKHLQENLIHTEEKLRESKYQVAPWHPETSNPHLPATTLATSSKNNMEIVPQPPYSHAPSPISSPSNAQTRVEWETFGNQNHHAAPSGVATKNLDRENLDRSSPVVSRTSMPQDASTAVHQGNIVDDSDAAVVQPGKETSVYWNSGNSPYVSSAPDDPNSSFPYLPPVLEEPGSSFSEAAEDDPLPAIEGLQISGEAFPGGELQASGYSINGTTSCNFEWVRYFENGAPNYIDGAKQPKYLVTADDVDTVLAIEVQPLDNRKRKGEPVQVHANDGRKITCEPEMQDQIERAYIAGHVSFEVLISAGALDIWERATLAIKRDAYSIKCNGPRGVVVAEKFQPSIAITIPFGHATEFSITCSTGTEYLLRAPETNVSRDTIVLTMRLFRMRAVERRKGKKRGLFFK